MLRRSMSVVAVSVLAFTTIAAGDDDVVIREWDVPTPNSRPHDPAVGPDGSLWYTGQLANKLGRLDEKSGEIQEFPLDIPNSDRTAW